MSDRAHSNKMTAKEAPPVFLGYYANQANTPGWISSAFSIYKAKCAGEMETPPEVRTVLDLTETVEGKQVKNAAFPRYRVLATTADPECLCREEFEKMLDAQKKKGHPRRVNFKQVWAIRDQKTSEIFICSPDVFVKLEGDKTTSARDKATHIMRVFPTWMAMEIIAQLHRAFLGSDDAPPTKKGTVPTAVTIMTQLKNIVKNDGGPKTKVTEKRKKTDGTVEDHVSMLPDYSIQIGKNAFFPVCPSSFLHPGCTDATNPDPKKKLKGPASENSSESKKNKDSDGEEATQTKRKRAPKKPRAVTPESSEGEDEEEEECEAASSVQDDEEEATYERAKRGRELSSIGALVDDGDAGTEEDEGEEAPDDDDENITKRLGRALRQLTDVVPDGREVTSAEVHRLLGSRLKKALPRISDEALTTLRKHLKVSEYDNSDLIADDPTNELAEMRRKTGAPADLMLPVHIWPVLLHCSQEQDADVHDFIANAPTMLSRASTDWGKEVLRPTSCNQIPAKWGGLLKAYILGAGMAVSQYETLLFSMMHERVEAVAAEACNTITAYEAIKEQLVERGAKLSDAESELARMRAREQELLAKIDDLEKEAKKLPPLPPMPKKPMANDF